MASVGVIVPVGQILRTIIWISKDMYFFIVNQHFKTHLQDRLHQYMPVDIDEERLGYSL